MNHVIRFALAVAALNLAVGAYAYAGHRSMVRQKRRREQALRITQIARERRFAQDVINYVHASEVGA